MPVFKRQDITTLTKKIAGGEFAPVYLIIGDRFLCREAAAIIEIALLPEKEGRQARLNSIDGEEENPLQTLAKLRTYNLFGGRQVFKVIDSRLLYPQAVAKDLWKKAEKVRQDDPGKALNHLRTMLGLAGLGPNAWQTDNLDKASSSQWQELFKFNKPSVTAWAGEILATLPPLDNQAEKSPPSDVAKAYMTAIEAGLPPNNILLLLTETVDKRKKLYKFLEKHAVIIDLSVASGSPTTARKDQMIPIKERVNQTLAGFGKRLGPGALNLLLERVGFHPAAAVMEAEKLAIYVGELKIINHREVDEMVGRTREGAIYELSEAYSRGDLIEGLIILERLQQDGAHSLAILGGLRNHVRKLLMVRAIQNHADRLCNTSIPFSVFKQSYLPSVRKSWERQMQLMQQTQQTQQAQWAHLTSQAPLSLLKTGPALPEQVENKLTIKTPTRAKSQSATATQESAPERTKDEITERDSSWPSSLPGHPYALYNLFLQAAKLSSPELRKMLRALLQAEYRLKSSNLPEKAIFSALLFATCRANHPT